MRKSFFMALTLGVTFADPALAYIGPGAGLSAIGTLLAIVAAAVLAIVGFVFYPLKRMLSGNKKVPQPTSDATKQSAKDA